MTFCFFTAKNQSDDPVCKLNHHERLRVCTTVLNSTYFYGELQFVPMYKYIDETECARRRISFQNDRARLQTLGKPAYVEWMISCKPKQYYASYQAEYFLSRVYDSNTEVFVYRRNDDSEIILENLFGNVRFRVQVDLEQR